MTDDEIVALAHKYIKPNRYPGKDELIAFAHAVAAADSPEAKPVAWMQSDHLIKLMMRHCGSQSMLARVSDHKLQSDYVPLYSTPPAAGMVSAKSGVTAPVDMALFISSLVNDANISGDDLPHQVVEKLMAAAKGGG